MAEPHRRSAILVTGMSGSGKTTALAELDRRGHAVVDTDDPSWIIQVQTTQGVEPMWDLDRIGERLARHRAGWLFVSGCVANQSAMYGRFDAIVLLSAPGEVILARVAHRANRFGSRSKERAKIASDLTEFEPLLRASADHEILTTASIADVVQALEQVAAEADGRPSES